MRQLPPTESE
ncbi:hypothetical protein LINGRAHAP2_LOCUS25045 [Linum grandiflorum]